MDEKIIKFIKSMQLLSWSMCDIKGVYTASAFYTFDEENHALIFASEEKSKHIQLAFKNPNIAVNIAKESKIAFLKGLQIKALFNKASKEQEKLYYQAFPFARLAKAEIYILEIYWAKFTDNTSLLGKKLEFCKKI